MPFQKYFTRRKNYLLVVAVAEWSLYQAGNLRVGVQTHFKPLHHRATFKPVCSQPQYAFNDEICNAYFNKKLWGADILFALLTIKHFTGMHTLHFCKTHDFEKCFEEFLKEISSRVELFLSLKACWV